MTNFNSNASLELVWGDPPPAPERTNGPGSRGVWVDRLAPLKARPGEWARVLYTSKNGANGTASGLRRGKFFGMNVQGTTPEFEFISRVDPDNTEMGGVYARFIGSTDAQPAQAG